MRKAHCGVEASLQEQLLSDGRTSAASLCKEEKMLTSKSRSGSADMPHRTSPGTPRHSKQNRGFGSTDSDTTPVQTGRLSLDKAPSKIPDRRSPRSTLPEKRVTKGPDLQQQLNQAQENLKSAKEQLALVEKAKSRALEELEESKKAFDEANVRLSEALVAEKRALEKSESEKFRADELEQATIESAQKRDQAWQSELEAVQRHHALDVAALQSANQELQRVKQDLSIAMESKATVAKQAEEAVKASKANAKKAEELSAEMCSLKEALDSAYASRSMVEDEKAASAAKWESEAKEATAMATKANQEVQLLKKELANVKDLELKLSDAYDLLEKLNFDLLAAKESESRAGMLADEANLKLERAELEMERARDAENKAFQSLMSATTELDEVNMSLEKAKSDSAYLMETVDSLKGDLETTREELESAKLRLKKAEIDTVSLMESMESLRMELEQTRADLVETQKREQQADSRVSDLTEELNKVRDELQQAIDAEEQSKKAMDDLALALHEVTAEAGIAKTEVQTAREEVKTAKLEVEHWKANSEALEEKYRSMLNEARSDMEDAKREAEEAKWEAEESTAAWNERESKLVECIKHAESEANAAQEEVIKLLDSLQQAESETKAAKEEASNLLNSLKETEREANLAKKDASKLLDSLKCAEDEANKAKENATNLLDSLEEAEAEIVAAKEDAQSAKMEISIVKDALLDKENELQNILQENEELKLSEANALEKIEQLKESLLTVSSKKSDDNSLSITKEEYDLLRRKAQEAEEHASKRIAEVLAQVEDANIREKEALQKLNAVNSDLEKSRQIADQSSEQLETVRIVKLALEADLKKSKEEAEYWKKAAAVTASHNGEMNGKIVDRSTSFVQHSPSESFGDAPNVKLPSPMHSEDLDQTETVKEDIDHTEISSTIKKKKPMLRKIGELIRKRSIHK